MSVDLIRRRLIRALGGYIVAGWDCPTLYQSSGLGVEAEAELVVARDRADNMNKA